MGAAGWTRGVKLTGDWNRVNFQTKAAYIRAQLHQHVGDALDQAARTYVLAFASYIYGAKYAKNRPLTIAIKKSNTPLIDYAQLVKGFDWYRPSWNDRWVGLSRVKAGHHFKIGVGLHEGHRIAVTTRMRWLFFALWAVRTGRLAASRLYGRAAVLSARAPTIDWMPLKKRTKWIKIKPRPFILKVRNTQAISAKVNSIMLRGVRNAMRPKK